MSFSNIEYEYNPKTNNISFPEGKIEGYVNQTEINNDIILIKSSLSINENIHFKAQENYHNGFLLSYNIKGVGNYFSENTDLKLTTSNNSSKILLTKNFINSANIKKGDLETVALTLKKEFLLKSIPNSKNKDVLLNELEKDSCSKLLSDKNISSDKASILSTIINTPFQGELNDIFLQSKVLELIYMEFKNLFDNEEKNTNKIKLDSKDILAIKNAKEILIHNIQKPPNIKELAKLVKINEFKLKLGFKKLYGTSPHNLLLNYKLDLAKELLIKGEMNIYEVSQYIGYKYTQNFTTAFTKKFSILPKELTKKRAYYY